MLDNMCRVFFFLFISLSLQSISFFPIFQCYSGYTEEQDAASGDLSCRDTVSADPGKIRVEKKHLEPGQPQQSSHHTPATNAVTEAAHAEHHKHRWSPINPWLLGQKFMLLLCEHEIKNDSHKKKRMHRKQV